MSSYYEPEVFRIPFPADYAEEPDADILARASAMCGAAETIFTLAEKSGQPIVPSSDDKLMAATIFDGSYPLPKNVPTGIAVQLTALLNQYDMAVVQDAQQLRNLCTNLLIEKAVRGKSEQVQLRAVEMLAKIRDVSLFDERTTVQVEHMTTEDLKAKLREKINTMRTIVSGDVSDVTAN